jgi:hypothetical protein
MIRPEARPVVAPENEITGRFLVANHEADRIHINREQIGEKSHRYTVTGEIALERQAIAAIMTTPLGYGDADWVEVREGLRDIAHPSKRVKALARGLLASSLRDVAPASRQLADILRDNQNQRNQTANVPVFSYFQSYDYTVDEVRKRLETKKLLAYLKNIGISQASSAQFNQLTISDTPGSAEAVALQRLIGYEDEELLEMLNSAILDTVDSRVEAELLSRLQELTFKGFRQQAQFVGSHLEGGGRNYEVYLRNQDIPENVLERLDSTKVSIGALLRDIDRKTQQPRHKVTFSTQAPRVIAHPQIVWESHNGKRTFKFPTNSYTEELPYGENRIVRRSSILGAALVINYLADVKGIDYAGELEARKRKAHRMQRVRAGEDSLHSAGLLPLVMTHQQAELLDDEYFSSIEAATR